jgi:hypothetical protein
LRNAKHAHRNCWEILIEFALVKELLLEDPDWLSCAASAAAAAAAPDAKAAATAAAAKLPCNPPIICSITSLTSAARTNLACFQSPITVNCQSPVFRLSLDPMSARTSVPIFSKSSLMGWLLELSAILTWFDSYQNFFGQAIQEPISCGLPLVSCCSHIKPHNRSGSHVKGHHHTSTIMILGPCKAWKSPGMWILDPTWLLGTHSCGDGSKERI